MKNLILWEYLKEMKRPKFKWVDLSYELSAETPHWYGFQPLGSRILLDFDKTPVKVFEYTFPGQYGTHVDIPAHFDPKGRTQEKIRVDEFAYPLCVIDKSEAVKTNPDYALTIEDIKEWETVYGMIPENAFVAFRSDWYKRGADLVNRDSEGNSTTPVGRLKLSSGWLRKEKSEP
ncbi:MAG TPA: cyclase family protein [Bacteroidales bacterium]|nr:cyclase family protein [Bacteroidales bacterium]